MNVYKYIISIINEWKYSINNVNTFEYEIDIRNGWYYTVTESEHDPLHGIGFMIIGSTFVVN